MQGELSSACGIYVHNLANLAHSHVNTPQGRGTGCPFLRVADPLAAVAAAVAFVVVVVFSAVHIF